MRFCAGTGWKREMFWEYDRKEMQNEITVSRKADGNGLDRGTA